MPLNTNRLAALVFPKGIGARRRIRLRIPKAGLVGAKPSSVFLLPPLLFQLVTAVWQRIPRRCLYQIVFW
jgi:hypothetical protein